MTAEMQTLAAKHKPILIGIIVAVVWWLLEAGVDAFVFKVGTFAERVFPSDLNELWMRGIAVCLVVGFGIYAERVIRKLQRMGETLHASNQQLRATEQQLKGEHQQVEANNQQLRATEQQLKAGHQQLKAANQQLRATEEKLRTEHNLLVTLIDNVPDSIYFKDNQSRFLLGNLTTALRAGVKKPEELLGKTDFDFYPQESAKQYFADEQELVQSGKALINREEQVINRTTGETLWNLTSKVPLRDGQGKVIGIVGIGRDITQRRQAEQDLKAANQQLDASNQQLRATEQQLKAGHQQLKAANQQLRATEEKLRTEHNLNRLVIDNTPNWVYMKDCQSRFTLCNAAAARVAGVTKPEELLGKTDFDLYPEELAKQYYDNEQKVIQSGKPLLYHEEQTIDQITGATHWNLISIVPVRDTEGKVTGIIGIGHDITQRRQAEQELKAAHQQLNANHQQLLATGASLRLTNEQLSKSEQRYTRLFDEMIHGFALHEIICDEQGRPKDYRYLQVNRAFEESTGLSARNIINKTVLEIMPETESSWIEIFGKVALTGESTHFENYSQEFDRHYEVIAYCPEPGKFATLFNDVTARKQTERQLQQTNQRLTDSNQELRDAQDRLRTERDLIRTLIDSLPESVSLKDCQGRFQLANIRSARSAGKTNPKDLIGKTDFDFFPKELAQRFYAKGQGVIESGKALTDYEDHAIDLDTGKLEHYLSSNIPLRNSEGQVVGVIGIAHNITQRKQAEEKLQHINQQLQTSVDQMPTAYILWDKDFRALEWNRAAEEIFGYTKEEVLGKALSDLIVPEAVRHLVDEVLEKLRNGESVDFSQKDNNITKDGTLISCQWHNKPLVNAEGNVFAILSIAEDVTERKQAEEALRQYEHIVSSTSDMMAILDANYTYLAANPAYAEAFNLARNEVVGKTVAEVFGKRSFKDVIKPEADRCLAGEEVTYQEWFDFPTRQPQFMEIHYYPYKDADGKVSGYVVNGRDITERKRIEENLRETNLLFDAILAKTPICVSRIDPDGTHTLSLGSGLKRLGLEQNQLVGENVFESYPHMKGHLETAKKSGMVEFLDEGVSEGKPWCFQNWLFFDSEIDKGFFSISVDITERKQAEEQLRKSLIEKELLLKEVHHRVKNNLQLMCSLIKLQLPQTKNKAAAKVLQEYETRIRALSLVHNKLYQSDDMSQVNFSEFVSELATGLYSSFELQHDKIKLSVETKDVVLQIDRAIPCGLILNELLTNSFKYAFANGNTGGIRVTLEETDSHIQMIVSDNGVGLPAGFSLEKAESLGLKLVHGLVRQLDGQVTVDTKHGTSFTITFASEQPGKESEITNV